MIRVMRSVGPMHVCVSVRPLMLVFDVVLYLDPIGQIRMSQDQCSRLTFFGHKVKIKFRKSSSVNVAQKQT